MVVLLLPINSHPRSLWTACHLRVFEVQCTLGIMLLASLKLRVFKMASISPCGRAVTGGGKLGTSGLPIAYVMLPLMGSPSVPLVLTGVLWVLVGALLVVAPLMLLWGHALVCESGLVGAEMQVDKLRKLFMLQNRRI